MRGPKSIVFLLLLLAVTGLYITTNILQATYQKVERWASNFNQKEVTFYQWTASNGEMIISRERPLVEDYISFSASPDLLESKNDVDPALILRSQRPNSSLSIPNSNSPKGSSAGGSSAFYPISAINKTKRCLELSRQMSEERDKQKDISSLKERYDKEC
jgi:hypothetical protein